MPGSRISIWLPLCLSGAVAAAPPDALTIDDGDVFGRSIAVLPASAGAAARLAIGAGKDDDGGLNVGAVWIVDVDRSGAIVRVGKIGATTLDGLTTQSNFGCAVANAGDVNGDGHDDLALGAFSTNDGGPGHGAIWVVMLDADARVLAATKTSEATGFDGALVDNGLFGSAIAPLGDLDGDGVPDLAVSARRDGTRGAWAGAVWVLFLERDGATRASAVLSRGPDEGSLPDVDPNGKLGTSMARLGDGADGRPEIAIGAGDSTVWIVGLDADGSARAARRIAPDAAGFDGRVAARDWFGFAVDAAGDLDGDGVTDLVVGARDAAGGGTKRGAVWILFMERDGTVRSHATIEGGAGGMPDLADGDAFGTAVAGIGDLDGDGVLDLAVGARGDAGGGRDRGAVWILFMNRDGTVRATRRIEGRADGDVEGS